MPVETAPGTAVIRFIVITVLPASLRSAIDRFRRRLADVSGSRAALAYPPHVTLRTGALVPAHGLCRFIDDFGWTAVNAPSCVMETGIVTHGTYGEKGKTKHLVHYPIVPTGQVLELNRSLLSCRTHIKGEQRSYAPHITVAFDDLTAGGRDRILDWIRRRPEEVPPPFSFHVDNISLYRLTGKCWTPFRVFRIPP